MYISTYWAVGIALLGCLQGLVARAGRVSVPMPMKRSKPMSLNFIVNNYRAPRSSHITGQDITGTVETDTSLSGRDGSAASGSSDAGNEADGNTDGGSYSGDYCDGDGEARTMVNDAVPSDGEAESLDKPSSSNQSNRSMAKCYCWTIPTTMPPTTQVI
ncbi:hypothetical protein BJ085DRAFT_29643 [Dimargaris cristalligena]|uniref:Uncharacterized protein n=1 Tax=Dimargaris cristalligena TaxID=215637 RepID=A0A4P9ZZ41_9FUNG|nr:hypothetical protein BJ085DRAFT_29643 [Dimargaris cristalligena]|eukprot:RKP38957.1 hypothetical protein BJ085DRAFT_29643 [Dimargaris cristalligena]